MAYLQRFVLSAIFLLAAPPVHADNVADLFSAARSFDATYLAARAATDAAQYKAEQSQALQRPSVGANVSANLNHSDGPLSDLRSKTATVGLSAKQSLYNPANGHSISQAQRQLRIAHIELEAAEQDLIIRVAQNYFDVLAAKDALGTAQASKKAISQQLASAKRNFEVGTATITDTREAQARFDLSSAQEIAADNELLTKRLALDQLVGRSNVEPSPVALPWAWPQTTPAQVEHWVAHAETAPSVRRAALAVEIAQLETQKAKAGHLPSLDAEAAYQKGHSDNQGSPLGKATGPTNQSNMGLTLRVPLFAGYAIENRVKETLALQTQAQNSLDATKRTSSANTRQTFFSLQSLQAQLKALEAAEQSSKLALDATQLGYKVGVRVNVDVLNAQTQLFTTQRDLAKARYDILVNSLKLRLVAGQLKEQDITALTPLFLAEKAFIPTPSEHLRTPVGEGK
jgi:outer membrane protein